MKESQVDTLILFLHRTSMYLPVENKECIISFMHGFEAGAGIDCIWSNLLSKHLESKYKVRKKALGWPYQVQVFADKKSMDWVLTFKQLMIEVIEISTLAYSTDRLERLKQGLNKK